MTQCTNPREVQEEDYIASLENDVRPQFAQHLKHCLYCQSELAVYKSLNAKMHQDFGFISPAQRVFCARTEQLGDYILGLLTPIETNKIKQHLNNCSYCSAEFQTIKTWLAEPDELLRDTNGEKLSWLRRVIATVVGMVDVGSTPAYAVTGLRGDTSDLPTTYQAEEVSVTLTVQPSDLYNKNDRMILGLVQRENQGFATMSGLQVQICKAGKVLATETIDEVGNFVFEAVQVPKLFDLEIQLEDKTIIVPDLGTI